MCLKISPSNTCNVVQLVGLVEVTLRYFFDWAMSFFQRFDNREKIVCKMGQTGHAEFIRLVMMPDVLGKLKDVTCLWSDLSLFISLKHYITIAK